MLPSHCQPSVVPRPSSVAETIEDSQEFATENGSRVQVVRDSNGVYRPLTDDERHQIDYDEMVEEEAAELEREEADREWRTFAASQYRTWEEWAVAAEVEGQPAKRARIQVMVQGLGGRIVRDVNWLVPLREGEQLSYTVNVIQSNQDEAEQDPTASSSGLPGGGMVQAGEVEEVEDARDSDASLLPVTGWQSAPVLDEGHDCSRPEKDFDVVEFVRSALGIKFFREWVGGRVTCRLVGQRFGYRVLSKFHAIQAEMNHVLQEGLEGEEAEEVARTRITTEGWDEMVNRQGQHGNLAPGELVPEGPEAGAGEVREGNDQGERDLRGQVPDGHGQGDRVLTGHVREDGAASGSECASAMVSAAEVIAQLEEAQEENCGEEEPSEENGGEEEPREEVKSEGSGSSKQTNIRHWLK